MKTKRKRHHHEGTVFRRKDGKGFAASVSLGKDSKGKRRRIVAYAATEAEARSKLVELKLRRNPSEGLTPNVTVREFLDRWLAYYVRPNMAGSSHTLLKSVVRTLVVPHIGSIPLSDLKQQHIVTLMGKLRARDLSPHTLRSVHCTLRSAFNHGIRWGLIFRNPCRRAKLPALPSRSAYVLTPDDMAAFLNAASNSRLYALYVLAATTGLRKGELFGLEWPDIDLEKRLLSVKRSIDLHTGLASGLKTDKSNRTVTLPQFANLVLRDHRKRMEAEGYQGERVFVNEKHESLKDTTFMTSSFYEVVDLAGIKPIRFHDLRHTCAATLLALGVQPKVVSERLGHGSVAFTMSAYAHHIPGIQASAKEKLEELFGGIG